MEFTNNMLIVVAKVLSEVVYAMEKCITGSLTSMFNDPTSSWCFIDINRIYFTLIRWIQHIPNQTSNGVYAALCSTIVPC